MSNNVEQPILGAWDFGTVPAKLVDNDNPGVLGRIASFGTNFIVPVFLHESNPVFNSLAIECRALASVVTNGLGYVVNTGTSMYSYFTNDMDGFVKDGNKAEKHLFTALVDSSLLLSPYFTNVAKITEATLGIVSPHFCAGVANGLVDSLASGYARGVNRLVDGLASGYRKLSSAIWPERHRRTFNMVQNNHNDHKDINAPKSPASNSIKTTLGKLDNQFLSPKFRGNPLTRMHVEIIQLKPKITQLETERTKLQTERDASCLHPITPITGNN